MAHSEVCWPTHTAPPKARDIRGVAICRNAPPKHQPQLVRGGGRLLSWQLSPLLFSGETIWRTGDHRRALPFGLHTRLEHDPSQPSLRYLTGCVRLSRTHSGRPIRPEISFPRRDPGRLSRIPTRRTLLDQASWRIEQQCYPASWQRAHRLLSTLQEITLPQLLARATPISW